MKRKLLTFFAAVFCAASMTAQVDAPLTFEAMEAGATVTYNLSAPIQYSTDGVNWSDYSNSITLVNVGDKVSFRGNNPSYNNTAPTNPTFQCSDDCYIYGNIMSLVDAENYATATTLTANYTFCYMFYTNTHIKNHSSKDLVLPATTLTGICYHSMFSGCTGLTRTPELPATTLASSCYECMFDNCTGLTSTPVLPATYLPNKFCYRYMFRGCSNLSSVTCYATGRAGKTTTTDWLSGVAASGTFYAPANNVFASEDRGASSIPEGWTISLPLATLTDAPTAISGLLYDGTAQALVTAGSATNGTMNYSLDNSTWSTSIPTGIDADTYTVYYKVAGDASHADFIPSPNTVEVTIAPAVASVTTSSDVTTNYATFSEALAAWEANSTLTLLADVTISSRIDISNTRTLDLNGYGIKMTGYDCIFCVQVGGNLTMIDSNPTRSTRAYNVSSYMATLADGGAYSFQGGYLTGGRGSTAEDSYNRGGAVLLKGANCRFTMRGGTIIGNRACFGGGVQVRRGRFVMEGGAIIYNKATDCMYHGGGAIMVDCGYGADLTLGGTALIEHNYTSGYEGGQVFVGSCADGQMVISGGSPRVINSASTNNLNLGSDDTNHSIMSITGALTADADLSLYVYRTGVLTSGYNTYHHGVDPNTFFSVQNEGYLLTLNAEGEVQAVAATTLTANQDPQHLSDYYSTFYHSAIAYELSAGAEAYIATISGDALNLTKIADGGQVIPADNAVILKANSSSITLTPSNETPVTFTATNNLRGTDEEIDTPANCYVLSCEGGVVGFYRYSGAKLNPHKAYVTTGSAQHMAAHRLRFVFNGNNTATDLERVENDTQNAKILRNGQLIIIHNGVKYNVSGQIVK